MKETLLFGAGKSATTLIEVLGTYCDQNGHKLVVCDQNPALAESKIKDFNNATAVSFDVNNEAQRQSAVSRADLVISLLPPSLHNKVAKDCLLFYKDLLTASYVDDDMAELADEIKSRGVLFLSEMGLDPGIDHMSAMRIVHDLQNQGAVIRSFYSHCGGLVAPESDDNPWHYKITWNPRNVVGAGSAGAQYLVDGEKKKISYPEIFSRDDRTVELEGVGTLGWYPNRDSLSYIHTYGLDGIDTFIRTTLRYPSYIRGWNAIVHLGLTDAADSELIAGCQTVAAWFELKRARHLEMEPESFVTAMLADDKTQEQFRFLGFYDDIPIKEGASSADILLSLLEDRLVMQPEDKDMIVMIHEVEYELQGKRQKLNSSLVVKGTDSLHTGMSKTVGTPLAIAAMLILEKKINLTGLHIPVIPEIYLPVLEKLKAYGIAFDEKTIGRE